MRNIYIAALVPLVASALIGAAPAPPRAEMVRLAELPDLTLSAAHAINDAGVIVGYGVSTSHTVYPVRWNDPDTPVRLAVPTDVRAASASDVNRTGIAIGRGVTPDGSGRALRWNPDGRLVELRPPTPGSPTATALDDRGTVVGENRSASGVRAVRWDNEGNPADLGTLPGGTQSRADAINNRGVILGSSNDASGEWHPVVWQPDGSIDAVPLTYAYAINDRGTVTGTREHAMTWNCQGWLTDLGLPFGATHSFPTAINDRGTVLGGISTADRQQRAVRWDRRGRAVDLGVLAEPYGSWGERLNDHDEAIGLSISATQTDHGVFWDRRGRLVDLSPDPDTASDAYDLNNHGTVVGLVGGAYGHAVLWRIH